MKAALAAKPEVRERALKSLVKTAGPETASDAMVQLIRLHSPDIETLAVNLAPTLPDMYVRKVIEAASRTSDSHLRIALARVVLQGAAAEAHIDSESVQIGFWSAAGSAARLLLQSEQRDDRTLLRRVLLMRPHDPGLWFAMAKLGAATPAELSLARSVMQDEGASPRVREAAAAVIAPHDARADSFAIGHIRSFLMEFAQKDLALMAQDEWRQGNNRSSGDLSDFARFRGGLTIISVLQYLQTPGAETIAFEFLDADNLFVRRALWLVAAQRWPERLLNTTLSHAEERSKMLAAVSVLHPELLSRVQPFVAPEELKKLRTKLENDGVLADFSMPNHAGLIF